jgi:hypothetical protein
VLRTKTLCQSASFTWTIGLRSQRGVLRTKSFAGVRGRASGGCNSGSPKIPFYFCCRRQQERKHTLATQCTHLDQIRQVTPSANGCEDCLKIGDTWVHLRICLECGHVGCCDSSKNKHATKHFHSTNHPIVQSFQPGEDWRWCYIDQVML